MTTYKNIDFGLARKIAFEHLGRLYTVSGNTDNKNLPWQADTWLVEVEVLKDGKTICIPLTVQLQPDFPLSLPAVFISKDTIPEIGYLPNISTNGMVCTFDVSTNIPDPTKPKEIIEISVFQAKKIIESGMTCKDNTAKYNQEFIAYWENKYDNENVVLKNIISLIPESGQLPNEIKFVKFQNRLGMFEGLLYSEQEQFLNIKNYLDRHQIEFIEFPTLFIGPLTNIYPPFALRNEDAIKIIEDSGKLEEFKLSLEGKSIFSVITFAKILDGRNLIFGWFHQPIEYKKNRHGSTKKKKYTKKLPLGQYNKILAPRNKSILVNRFSPQVLTWERLTNRTLADYYQTEKQQKKSILLAGLGSVGSNFMPYLDAIGVKEFRLADPDVLTVENIGRHLLGLGDVGKQKTTALFDYFQVRNPLVRVQTRETKIVNLIIQEPTFLSQCDYLFFCTGDINSEMWVLENLQEENVWRRPSFFIWVEPYLAGGHCIYYDLKDKLSLENLFPENMYLYNILADTTHKQHNFSKREAGCQTTFIPYGREILQRFLAALFPKVIQTITTGEKGSRAFSWIGDKNALEAMELELSDFTNTVASFSLVEREIC